MLKPHQRARIDSLVAQLKGDDRYNRTIGFQADRARTLVGAGGFFGNGEENSKNLVRFNALPEEHNDMIFAVVACRWGLMGGMLVIFLEAKTRPVFATRSTVLSFAPVISALTVYGFEAALWTCGARALTAVLLRPTPAASKVTIANILHELEIFISFPRIVKYQFPKKKA